MFEYRVTKYDPKKRDGTGAFIADDWTSQTQIGQTFGSVVLTAAQYHSTEDAYVKAALAFLRESAGESLRVVHLENHDRHEESGLALRQGVILHPPEIDRVCRLNLRGTIWCKLEDDAGRFIHFGYDYYMYVGVPTPCQGSKALARDLNLFVEEFRSPYHGTENH
ncbi:MAG TPA: hypothetical protein VIM11_15910 [Tepidisphaeraceae bacterium]|jgi:hypothetical protein